MHRLIRFVERFGVHLVVLAISLIVLVWILTWAERTFGGNAIGQAAQWIEGHAGLQPSA
ncbi:MAG: hypothetical protein IRY83_15275 [Chloroflexi bacterium]|nr:hypothetical protein [Chloroflexota bacterium]